MNNSEKTAFRMLQEIYVLQQNEEVTEENIKEYGLIEEYMTLIHSDENVYIVLYNEMGLAGFCNIIRKDDGTLIETIELA